MGRQNESPWVPLFLLYPGNFWGYDGCIPPQPVSADCIICLTKLLKLWAPVSRSIICIELLGYSHICKSVEAKTFYIFYIFPGMSRSKYEMRKCMNRNMNILWFTKVGYMGNIYLPNMISPSLLWRAGRAVLNYLGGLLFGDSSVVVITLCRVPELRLNYQCNNCALSNVDIARNACVQESANSLPLLRLLGNWVWALRYLINNGQDHCHKSPCSWSRESWTLDIGAI